MSAAPKYNHIPKKAKKTGKEDVLSQDEIKRVKHEIEQYKNKIETLLKDKNSAQKAALIIEQLLKKKSK